MTPAAQRGRGALAALLLGGLALLVVEGASAFPRVPSPAVPLTSSPAPSGAAPAPPGTPEVSGSTPEDDGTTARAPYPGDPDREAAVVAAEDSRLSEARTVASLSRWTDKPLRNPYRLTSGASYTLVLTERRAAYTLTDLLVLAPQTFVRQADGSYLLTEHIVVQAGATLRLAGPDQLTLKMASDERGFVSVVGYGGRIEISGTDLKPVRVTSWDQSAGGPDAQTSDGRAYIRAIGGQVAIRHAELSHLGFWSGRTGGLSLTGTDRPTPGALDDMGKQLTVRQEKDRAAARDANPDVQQPDSTGGVTLDTVLPAGSLPLPLVDVATPAYSYVSAQMAHVKVSDSAYGLFAAGANGVDIRDCVFERNLLSGVVMHRYVTNAVIERAVSESNGGDGFILSRATTGTILSAVMATGNQGNGITINGRPLATGPSATGTPVGDYGNNSVANSTSRDNARYGIEVIGGHHTSVAANTVVGNDMGIVIREGAREVTVVGNAVDGQDRQGIAIRDGVSASVVSGNIVTGGQTSVYVRNSQSRVERNTLTGADTHSVSLVGSVEGTTVRGNTIAGRGPSALDVTRAEGMSLKDEDNDVRAWQDTTPWLVTLKRLAQPLTLLWTALALLVVFTALRGMRLTSRRAQSRSPYGDRERLHRPEDVLVETPAAAVALRTSAHAGAPSEVRS